VNPSKKAYISFLMSVFLMSGIAALVYIGVFDFKNIPAMPNPVKAVAFVMTFFALFLFGFFLFNIKRSSSMKKKTVTGKHTEDAKNTDAGNYAGLPRHKNGLLAAATTAASLSAPSGSDVIYEKNGIPYINSDLVSDLTKNNRGPLDSKFVKLVESVTNAACSGTTGQASKGS